MSSSNPRELVSWEQAGFPKESVVGVCMCCVPFPRLLEKPKNPSPALDSEICFPCCLSPSEAVFLGSKIQASSAEPL